MHVVGTTIASILDRDLVIPCFGFGDAASVDSRAGCFHMGDARGIREVQVNKSLRNDTFSHRFCRSYIEQLFPALNLP